MLENPGLAVEELAVAVFIGQEQHQGALEVEHDQVGNLIREAGLHLLRGSSVLLVRLQCIELVLNLLLLLSQEFYFALVE